MDSLPTFAPTQVFRVSQENVTPLWPQAEPLIERALHGSVTHDVEDIRKMILGGAAHLWAQWSDWLEAIAVSEFAPYPRGIWVRVWLAAVADGARFDDAKFFAVLDHWREMHGCRGFEAIGRLGWLRRVPGARFIGAVMRTEG